MRERRRRHAAALNEKIAGNLQEMVTWEGVLQGDPSYLHHLPSCFLKARAYPVVRILLGVVCVLPITRILRSRYMAQEFLEDQHVCTRYFKIIFKIHRNCGQNKNDQKLICVTEFHNEHNNSLRENLEENCNRHASRDIFQFGQKVIQV